MMLATPQAFGNESQHQRIEGNPLGLRARGELGMDRLWNACNELSGCHPAAVGRRHRQALRIQGGNRRLERVMPVGDGLCRRLAVGNALGKIRIEEIR